MKKIIIFGIFILLLFLITGCKELIIKEPDEIVKELVIREYQCWDEKTIVKDLSDCPKKGGELPEQLDESELNILASNENNGVKLSITNLSFEKISPTYGKIKNFGFIIENIEFIPPRISEDEGVPTKVRTVLYPDLKFKIVDEENDRYTVEQKFLFSPLGASGIIYLTHEITHVPMALERGDFLQDNFVVGVGIAGLDNRKFMKVYVMEHGRTITAVTFDEEFMEDLIKGFR